MPPWRDANLKKIILFNLLIKKLLNLVKFNQKETGNPEECFDEIDYKKLINILTLYKHSYLWEIA